MNRMFFILIPKLLGARYSWLSAPGGTLSE